MKDTIKIEDYTVTIQTEDAPENPFESWDCEPPLLTFYGYSRGGFKTYGAIKDLNDIINLLPASLFERGQRVGLIKQFLPGFNMRDFALEWRNWGSFKGAFLEVMSSVYGGNTPDTRSGAAEWFDAAESLLKLASIACYRGESTGYAQGESTLVLTIATPEWAEKVGVPADSLEAQCKSAFDLYSAWAWGDVYGVPEITAPNGDTVQGADCWGFYGSDHVSSGLMEHAREVVRAHKEELLRENLDAANRAFFGRTSLTPV